MGQRIQITTENREQLPLAQKICTAQISGPKSLHNYVGMGKMILPKWMILHRYSPKNDHPAQVPAAGRKVVAVLNTLCGLIWAVHVMAAVAAL